MELGYNNLVIIDADDLLNDPENILSKYCSKVGLKYTRNITSWKPGYDGNKHCKLFTLWHGWHDDILSSNGFMKNNDTKYNEYEYKQYEKNMPKEIQNEIKKAFVIYNKLYTKRLK
eukprot:97726_1